VWTSLLVAFVAAGAFVIVLMVSGRATRTTTVPFGPFLAGGAIVTVLVTGV
jgi:prepilin signal peptidase PulO-like enzyme (type II secretory pathway)